MGAIRVNIEKTGEDPTAQLINIDAGSTYTATAQDDQCVITATDSASNATVYTFNYNEDGSDFDVWKTAIKLGLDVQNDSRNENVSFSNIASDALSKAISIALESDNGSVVDFSYRVPFMSEPNFIERDRLKDEFMNNKTKYVEEINKVKTDAEDAGRLEFRLPEGGGIAKVATFSNDKIEAYASLLAGNGWEDYGLTAYAMSKFKDVTIS